MPTTSRNMPGKLQLQSTCLCIPCSAFCLHFEQGVCTSRQRLTCSAAGCPSLLDLHLASVQI